MSNPDDYTIGWICAVHVEIVAAQAFLDEEHAPPVNVRNQDNNAYTLGKIGRHNVVIASLPHWDYGSTTAATVARDLVHTFPNVRLGLMVGIGGGAPSQTPGKEHDIRLGDIVVSSPSYGSGGVLQYDYGIRNQDGSFSITGYLNQPPQLVLTAVATLRARYELKGHELNQAIDSALTKYKKIRTKYQRPEPSTDRLYQPSHTADGICAKCKGDDESCLELRTERSDEQDNPAIHYGLIASANQVMKDASVRDRLSAEKDILCFEMEAAGLMNHFPCVVIRGVCDYADSHKNVHWQGYAAMAAAAYAKDLLKNIAPNQVDAERTAKEVLADVSQRIEDVYSLTKNVNTSVGVLQEDSHAKRVRIWLSSPDPSTNFNKALKQRHRGSGQWFIQHKKYSAWKTKQRSFLWLYGIPGCGKTILSSTVIKDLDESKPATSTLLYHYFDFTDSEKQNFEGAVRSLINQLYDKKPDLRKYLDSLHASCGSGDRQPSDDALRKTLQSMIEQAGEVWIILDALDECPKREEFSNVGLLSWIESLHSLKCQGTTHLLVTSRPERDIKQAIEGWAGSDNMIPIDSDLIESDIQNYIHARLRDGKLKRWQSRPEVQGEIEATLLEKADGLFRWVSCQLDDLETRPSYDAVKMALASLPKTLDDTYARILKNIPENYQPHTTRILQFLTCSDRPMTVDEAVDALAVNTKLRLFDQRNRIPDSTEVSSFCSSLITTIRTKADSKADDIEKRAVQIQLAHFSVKEYLISDRLPDDIAKHFKASAVGSAIIQVSLAYLLSIERGLLVAQIKQTFPFSSFAAQYWARQARKAGKCTEEIQQLIAEFFECTTAYEYCYRLHHLDPPWKSLSSLDHKRCPSPLYYASAEGLVDSCRMLLDKGAEINAQEGENGTALLVAVQNSHKEVVKLLLQKGADPNARDEKKHNSAIQIASSQEDEDIVQMLLENGADVNAEGGQHSTALQEASLNGNERMVLKLLKYHADMAIQDEILGTALYIASHQGYKGIVQILLENEADVNGQDRKPSFALAARPIFEDSHYGSALYAASHRGHEEIVRMLLRKGAKVNVQGGGFERNVNYKYSSTALQAASYEGHERVVQRLLEKGADVNAPRGWYGTALQAASWRGHEGIVQRLLEEGADVNAPGGGFIGTALQAAWEGGYERIAQTLLEEGADVNTPRG